MTDPLDRQPSDRGTVIEQGSSRLHVWPMGDEAMVLREPNDEPCLADTPWPWRLFGISTTTARIRALVNGRLKLRTEER